MSDTNNNKKIDPDEAEGTVKEEGIVNEAYLEDKVTEKDIEKIDTLNSLSTEAEKIKMESGMGISGNVSDIKAEDIKVEVPDEEKAQPEENPQPTTPILPEAAQEVKQEIVSEPSSEPMQEVKSDNEVAKEFKPGI